MSRRSASIGAADNADRPGGTSLASSTPEALWSAASLRHLRPTAITCVGLSRGRLLDRCSLTIPVGMRLLLLADPEASGSLLLRGLAGLTRVEGRISMAGIDDPSGGWGRRVAYVGPEPGLHDWMTPREVLDLAAALLELPPTEASRRADRALGWVRIPNGELDRSIRRGGPPLRQRVAFAAALLGDPEVLLLDEPLRALDPHERAYLLRLPGRRRTIVLASRYPTSEAGLVSHVALLRRGRVELVAPIFDLEAQRLPLSTAGVAALADRARPTSSRPR